MSIHKEYTAKDIMRVNAQNDVVDPSWLSSVSSRCENTDYLKTNNEFKILSCYII